jgi:hypothetical protein
MFLERLFTRAAKHTAAATPRMSQRGLFTGKSRPKEDYDENYPGTPLVRFDVGVYKNTTLIGKPIDEKVGQRLLTSSFSGQFVFRGMKRRELNKPVSKSLKGLVGTGELVVLNKDGTRNEEETRKNVLRHAVHSSYVTGVSTSKAWSVAWKFSSFLIPLNNTVIAVRPDMIPENQRFIPALLEAYKGEAGDLVGDSEAKIYPGEYEMTITHIPAWTVVAAANREGFVFSLKMNPLYVDKDILSPRLKAELEDLTKEFFRLTPIARTDINHPEVEAFKERLLTFYSNYTLETGLGPLQQNAINENFRDVKGFELESDKEKKPKGPG